MQGLVERADLGRPVTFELAEIVFADFARPRARRLDHVAERARPHGVGSQLIDHDVSPVCLSLVVICVALPGCGRSAERCAAKPGSILRTSGRWVPAQRSSVKNAAPRRDTRLTPPPAR